MHSLSPADAFLAVATLGTAALIEIGAFILIGLIILSSEYIWAHHLLTKLRARFPKISRTADGAALKAGGWLRRLSRQRGPD